VPPLLRREIWDVDLVEWRCVRERSDEVDGRSRTEACACV
jgi:hypothetical protein